MTTIRRALITITCTAVMVAASFPTVASAATFAPDTNTVSGNSLRPSTRATSPAPRASRIAIKIKAGRTKTVSFAGVSGLPPAGIAEIRATVSVLSTRKGSITIRPRASSASTTIRFSANRIKQARISRAPGQPRGWSIRNKGTRAATVTVTVTGHTLTPNPGGGPSEPGSGPPDPGGGGVDIPREIDHSPDPIDSTGRYDAGTFTGTDIYVNPSTGSDSNSGSTTGTALRTITAAWGQIPAGQTLTTGRRIQLAPGIYPADSMPNYWENRRGTYASPVILNATGGRGTAILEDDVNLFRSSYVYFIGLDIKQNSDAFHCEECSNILIRNSDFDGDATAGGARARETIKVNQSDHVYIEDSTVSGAEDNAIDFVAVQYGHLLGNRISDANDWCAYVKGGSAYLTVANNEIYNCGTGGFTAGQGTGFEFMSTPWLHYEAYDIRVFNNLVHDTEGAGLGVNGGYNILMAYNTMYRVGSRAHALEFVFGARGCDGDSAACNQRRDAGGWGSSQSDSGTGWVPNKHVYVYNNVLYNPSGFRSLWQHFAIYGPRTVPSGNTLTGAQLDDDDLRIAGNVIWNGPSTLDLGVGGSEGCGSFNPTCNETQLLADNAINTVQPQLDSSLRPTSGGNIATRSGVAIPSFTWTDAPAVPAVPMRSGFGSNSVPNDRAGLPRTGWGRPGAY